MTAATAKGVTRPALTCTVKLGEDKEQEIKLSYGLFQDLQRAVPDPGALIETITSDPYTRDYILRRCLTPTRKMIKDPDTELIDAEKCELDDPDEAEKLLQWVAEHMLYFFATSAGGMKRLAEAFKDQFNLETPPAPSTTGSPS